METILTVIHVLVCFFLIGIVLLQHGKGADVGATFGGSSQSLFGTEGPLPLLNKITTASAIVFMLTSVSLAYYSADQSTSSVMQEVEKQQQMNVEEPAAKKDIVVPLPTEEQKTTQDQQATFPKETPKEQQQ